MNCDDPHPTRSRLNAGQIRFDAQDATSSPAERTLIVTGVARGGTSMVAAILEAAGVPLGRTADYVVHEDVEIFTALSQRRRRVLKALIAERNRAHAVWGFKCPDLQRFLTAGQLGWFRNPRMIVILRDPVAIARRNVVSMYGDPRRMLVRASRNLSEVCHLAEQATCPVLLLSYEKALARPEDAVTSILEFCGLATSEDVLRSLKSRIRPENEDYLRAASLDEPPAFVPAWRRVLARVRSGLR